MKKWQKNILVALAVLLAALLIAYITPTGRRAINTYAFGMQKADDETAYVTKKGVEDTCRGMIASYTADKLMYEQYKDSSDKEKQGWAEQAKMRANRTAASYNEYVLKNSFVWRDDVPADIFSQLGYIS